LDKRKVNTSFSQQLFRYLVFYYMYLYDFINLVKNITSLSAGIYKYFSTNYTFIFQKKQVPTIYFNTITGWIEETQKKLESTGQWKELLDKIEKCTTNTQRLETISQLDGMEKLVAMDAVPSKKSEEEAFRYREAGNALYQKKEFVKALKQYNRSVMLSPIKDDTSTLSLAFANR